ncbi:General transcription and DNA repair factor IIH subunit tcf-29 [Pseudocercospora fuligena]|uniref:General transcription and DNA repair factor IIH subunit tcf-29 n=1 Tax=Pseudocercospora fuligena TaxID=685502 RepID=A0A8H6VJC3_9PEZI|nr:General transcription and DNA repair factor IIH subunit tcf-29 [Pseudocercospora fuligena]
MPPTIATVSYKKKDGTLTVAEDKRNTWWTPADPPSSAPAVTINVTDITNLQQTPKTSNAIALKILVKENSYVFTFNHKDNAREEQQTVTDVLSAAIAANKAKDASKLVPQAASASGAATPTPQPGENGGQSAAMAIAKAVSSKGVDDAWYDDAKLKSDFNLQRSLLESNKPLSERFNQALKDKPESVSVSQFTSQFWSARIHLLRAHAIDKAQKQGEYNVLPEIKFVREPAKKEGEPDTKKLQLSKEQIHMIFKQYPVVKQAYDDTVPKPLSPGEFWTKFFNSRLLKKLKGEKITQHDPTDRVLDKYLDREATGPASIAHIPHWMDLEGNEQNHSQRKGNRPDEDMRPSSYDKVPILRVLNNLSEKMMAHVAPEDGEAHAPIGLDEETFEQLRLQDLANEESDNRVRLNVKEQQRYVGGDKDALSADAQLYAKQDPRTVLWKLNCGLQPQRLGSDEQGTLRLDQVIGYNSDDSDSDEDDTSQQVNGAPPKKKRKHKFASHGAMTAASKDIMSSIKNRRNATSSDPNSLNGLSESVYENLAMTHNTTTEFLHYFWSLFLSGDASRTAELAQLVSTLDRSLDRINAVGEQAEAERQKRIDALKQKLEERIKNGAKRRNVDFEKQVPGGKKAVDAMIKPTVQALQQASNAYRKAFEEQTKEAAAAGLAA